MTKRMNKFSGSILIAMVIGLTACGQSFKSQGASSVGANNATDISSEMTKAEEANQAALSAVAEANAALAEITDNNGNINISLFGKSNTSEVQAQGLADPIINKLRGVFDQVFAKVTIVKTKFGEARTLLMNALAKLDANDPAQAALIAQVMSQLSKIDAMEAQFSASMHSLAAKLDLAISGLDKLVSGVTSFIPGFGWVADLALDFLVMGDIKAYITEIKMRLLAL